MVKRIGSAKNASAIFLAAWLAACSALPTPHESSSTAPVYFDDARFAVTPIDAATSKVMEPSPEMKAFVADVLRRRAKAFGPVKALIATLNDAALVGFRYEADITRSASETFATRTGNCLSLALMTASLAELMGLEVEFQSVKVPEAELSTEGTPDLLRTVGHVNLRVAERSASRFRHWTTIDFLVPDNAMQFRATPIERDRVVSLYFNNRAIDAFVQGELNVAYWWSRASIDADPTSSVALNSLGAIWTKLGQISLAKAALEKAAELDPSNRNAEFNLLANAVLDQKHSVAGVLLTSKSGEIASSVKSRVVALIKSGQWGRAEDTLNSPEATKLGSPDRAWLQALVALAQGQRDRASQTLKSAVSQSPDPKDAAYLRAKLARVAEPSNRSSSQNSAN